jgi:hypothetical protein
MEKMNERDDVALPLYGFGGWVTTKEWGPSTLMVGPSISKRLAKKLAKFIN